jgi:hypothetical protein
LGLFAVRFAAGFGVLFVGWFAACFGAPWAWMVGFRLCDAGFRRRARVLHIYRERSPKVSLRSAEDARPLVAVVGVLVALALVRGGGPARWAVARDGLLAPSVLVPTAVAALAALTCRVVVTRRSLARRVRLLVLAPDSFSPTLEGVLRCAAQLSRVRRLVGGWLDPRACAVRVLLDVGEGAMRYSLEVPERALPAIRSALGSYDRVQVRRLESEPVLGEGCVVRAELRLAQCSSESLAHLGLDPDPLQSFARALADLDPSRERAQVAVDLLPSTAGARRRLRRSLLRRARRENPGVGGGSGAGLLDVLVGASRRAGRQPAADVVEQRAQREQIAAKVLQNEPLFSLQVLIRCQAPVKGIAAGRLQSLLGCFDAWAAANSFRVVGVRLLGLAFLGSDLPGRRAWFDHRLETGLFRPARRNVVGAREVAGFLKPPTVSCAAPDVLRLGAAVYPPPRDLPDYTGQRDVLPLGRVISEHGQRIVGLRLADTFFTYTAGRSRWGKTELAITQFLSLVRSGHGGMFLDPHEDAIRRIKSCLTEPELAERIIELDLVGARSREGQPGWNLLSARNLTDDARERRIEAIVDSFASALQWGERNNRALTLTTQATAALIELSTHLPAELQPTIFQIPTLLGNPEWLQAVLPHLSVPRRQFFSERFPRMAEEAITPVTNLIDRLRSSTPLAALLGSPDTSYDIAKAMDDGRIVLACPGAGGARDRLVANLLVFDLLHAAKGRAHIAPERRREFYVFLDEVQTYDGASSGNLAALLEQTAKYGVRATLLNQNPERLTSATLNALTTNRSHLITTALNAHAAAVIAREWGSDPPANAISGLPRWTFIAQSTHHGQLTRPFQFENLAVTDLFTDAHHPDRVPHVQPAIDEASGRALAAETIAALDTLDERIHLHLTGRTHSNHRGGETRERSTLPRLPEPERTG